MDKMCQFLEVVRTADFSVHAVPRVWADQYREALSSGLVNIHFGGSIRLSEAGHERLKAGREALAATNN